MYESADLGEAVLAPGLHILVQNTQQQSDTSLAALTSTPRAFRFYILHSHLGDAVLAPRLQVVEDVVNVVGALLDARGRIGAALLQQIRSD